MSQDEFGKALFHLYHTEVEHFSSDPSSSAGRWSIPGPGEDFPVSFGDSGAGFGRESNPLDSRAREWTHSGRRPNARWAVGATPTRILSPGRETHGHPTTPLGKKTGSQEDAGGRDTPASRVLDSQSVRAEKTGQLITNDSDVSTPEKGVSSGKMRESGDQSSEASADVVTAVAENTPPSTPKEQPDGTGGDSSSTDSSGNEAPEKTFTALRIKHMPYRKEYSHVIWAGDVAGSKKEKGVKAAYQVCPTSTCSQESCASDSCRVGREVSRNGCRRV